MAGGAQKTSQFNQATSVTQADQVPLLQGGELKRVTVGILTGAPDFGWSATGESWTYSSYNSTYKIGIVTVPSDATVKYQPGMRVRFSQATGGTKYAIIHAVSTTTLTLFMGRDYTLTNEAISTPVYSPLDTPFGFNKDPQAWTVSYDRTDSASQASPAASTWYNIGGSSLAVGIGVWRLEYGVTMESQSSGNSYTVQQSTLSTATNTANSNNRFNIKSFGNGSNATGAAHFASDTVTISSNTTFYLNFSTNTTATTNIQVYGGTGSGSFGVYIRAVSAYL